VRAPDKVMMDVAYAEWQKASERLAEMRDTNSTFAKVLRGHLNPYTTVAARLLLIHKNFLEW
jgi:nitrate reductase assembly molybdenum cofactor insertion protein NarJ